MISPMISAPKERRAANGQSTKEMIQINMTMTISPWNSTKKKNILIWAHKMKAKEKLIRSKKRQIWKNLMLSL